MKSDNLIFIVALPRSGSTLLQSILSNNDYINTTSEPWLLLPFLNIFDSSLIEAKYNQKLAVTGIFNFANKVGGEDVLVEKLRDFLLSVYAPLSIGNVKYILDKTPRYYEILPHIQKVFPEAKIILLKRNPFAVLNSIIDTWGETNTIADLYPFKRDILYAPFLIQTFLEENRINDEHVREVFYENLAQKPKKYFKELYEWLEIPYDSSVLDYSKNDKYRGLRGDQAEIKERNKPTNKSIGTWQKKFTDSYWGDFFKGYAAFLGKEFLSSYGNYSIEFIGKNSHETSQFQKFKYFSEDKLIDINFVDAIKDYKRYDLTIRQLNIQNEQLEQQKKQLSFQKEQLNHQKNQLKFQNEQFKRQKERENQQRMKESQQLIREKKQKEKALMQVTREKEQGENVLKQLEQEKEQKEKALMQVTREKEQGENALKQLKQEKEQKEKALMQVTKEKEHGENVLKQLRQEKEVLLKTFSWQITKPLRSLKKIIG